MTRWSVPLTLLALVLPGCTSAPAAPCADTQAIVDDIARQHTDLVRLTVHGTPPAGGAMCAIASTSDDKRGQPSDPEDHRAITNGETVVLAEGDGFDVTVPILRKDGSFTAAAGVTMRGADRAAVVALAQKIAQQVEAAIQKKRM